MRQANLTMMSATMLLAARGGTKDAGETDQVLIERSDIKIEGKHMAPEALWAMGRIDRFVASLDGEKTAYTVVCYGMPENKSNRKVFVMNTDGSENQQITHTPYQKDEVARIKGGTKLASLSNDNESSQLYKMNSDGSGRKRLISYDGDTERYSISPDGRKLLFISQVRTKESIVDEYPGLPKATGIIITDLMYKYWGGQVMTTPHPFAADFDGNGIPNIADILSDEPYESPMKPRGGIEQLVWNITSDKVACTCRKRTGLEYAISTSSDIYIYDLNTKGTENITEEDKGYDINPQYSPNGKYIAWQSMERDGYETDLNRLFIMSLEANEKCFASKALGSSVDAFVWGTDVRVIHLTGAWHGELQICAFDLASGSVEAITSEMYGCERITLFGDKLIAERRPMSIGNETYSMALNGSTTQLTQENKRIYDQLGMGKVEGRRMKTTNGKQVSTWVVYPPQFGPSEKYSALLFCERGPQSPVSQFWFYRWNSQVMAVNDCITVAPNRCGLPGFGVGWNEQISGDYGGRCMGGYFTAIDEMVKESYMDKDRLGCIGASSGGFSVCWSVGHHDKRLKVFIARDDIFSMEMQYLETEEKWLANWNMGGAYWGKQNPVTQRTPANFPHLFVEKQDIPILCIHGEKDHHILANQTMAAFDATVMRGVPAELLIYPDENHWVLKPQNGVLQQRIFFEWLDKRVKKASSK